MKKLVILLFSAAAVFAQPNSVEDLDLTSPQREEPAAAVKEEPAAATVEESAAPAGEDHAAAAGEEPDTLAAEEPVTETAESEPEPVKEEPQVPPAAEAPKASVSETFVLSVRPKFASGFAAMAIGGSVEMGAIINNDLYIAGEWSIGRNYFGIEVNAGKRLSYELELKNIFGGVKVKNIWGGVAGFHNTSLPVKFRDVQTGEIVRTKDGSNVGIVGGFWKVMLGGQHNLDITNKILLGYKKNPSDYDGTTISYDKGFDMTYVLGIGYTLTKVKN